MMTESMQQREPLARRLAGIGATIFTEMSALARKHGAVNLGQGFPDFPGPDWVKQAAKRAIDQDINQYAIGYGSQSLRQQLAAHYSRPLNRELDPNTDIVVTSGATEAIMAGILGLVDPGDEVIVFEPFYDSYVPAVQFAGGLPRYIPLRPPDDAHANWWFDGDELASAFGPQTKLVLLNTPNNPTGKVYTRDELQLIADLCQQWDAYVLSDEVYEYIVFDDCQHVSISTLPGMWERTLTISSSGKTFSLTGWKIGWSIAPPALNAAVGGTHQFITFATSAPMQEAIAAGFAEADARGYYAELRAMYQHKRDLLVDALAEAGLRPYRTEGTYFILCNISHLGFDDDVTFCRWLTTDVGVTAIPPTFFYSEAHKELGRQLARFSFCKQDATLRDAAQRLLKWSGDAA
jgi:N-succinyldiaminopimelate aminotransferase